jgi:acyl dehydratase
MLSVRLADLIDHQGADLGHSNWIDINQARIDGFADVTGDRQWIHVDPVRAASGPFGTTIAHGYLTLSLVSVLLFELLDVHGAGSVVNYGLDRVRFPSPVPVVSKVRAHGNLVAVTEMGHATQTTTRFTLEIEGGVKPAMVADVLTRFQP